MPVYSVMGLHCFIIKKKKKKRKTQAGDNCHFLFIFFFFFFQPHPWHMDVLRLDDESEL